MKKLIKPILVFVFGVILGYYLCFADKFKNIFSTSYKAFQVGVYTSLDAANTYRTKYQDSIVVKDNELYRVYVSILKDNNNIDAMKKYLDSNNISYYLKDIEIIDKNIKKEINEYENIMNSDNEIVFLEVNKMIIEKYEESL